MSRGEGRMVIELLLALVLAQCSTAAAQSGASVDPGTVIGEPAGAPRAGAELDRVTGELAKVMRCPVCQGLPIADSPSQSATAMKAEVRELLAQGYSGEQVMDYFEASFGEFVRLKPKAEGFNLLVWIAPVLMLGLGLGLVARQVRRGAPVVNVPEAATKQAPMVGEEQHDDELAAYREQVRREVTR